MTPIRRPRGRTCRALIQRGLLFAALVPLGGSAVFGAGTGAASTAAGGARLIVDAPAHVAVGQAFRLRLSVDGARDLAGYETQLRFDNGAARFGGIAQRGNDLRRLGREVRNLGPVEGSGGVSFGAYSCSTADCATRRGPAKSAGRARNVHLVTVELVAERAGRLELDLAGMRFVDSGGHAISIDTSVGRRLTVQVGDRTARIPAPRVGEALRGAGTTRRTRDVTGDGTVTHADALAVRAAWTAARESTGSCRPVAGAINEDIDTNGCIDVSDVQSVVGSFSAAGAQRPSAYAPRVGVTPRDLATWVVNSIGDAADVGDSADNDLDSPNGVCATTSGRCTLRAAIFEANRHDGTDRITFAIPDSQAVPNPTDPKRVWRIQLAASRPLPTIYDETGGLTIDGYTQPGATVNTSATLSNAKLKVEIRGPGEGETSSTEMHAFELTSPNNLLKGLAMYRLWKEVHLLDANDNRIVGNFIGTDAAATYSYGVNLARTAAVYLEDAAGNDIGAGGNANRNVVSGNQWTGIYTTGEAANGNRIRNNLVGLSPNGTRRLGNLVIGIDINLGSSRNIVSGNTISGNGREGLEISHGITTAENEVFDNLIGTYPNGTSSSPTVTANGWDTTSDAGGVKLEDGTHHTLFHDNVVAGNILNGIFLQGGAGTGGDPTEAHHNHIYNNRIGVGLGGEALPNSCPTNGTTCVLIGVRMQAFAQDNVIGPGNEIANFQFGVYIQGEHSDRNTITQNAMHDNARGIELTPPGGVDPNGSNGLPDPTGPNDSVDHPMIATATVTEVTGQACPGCTVEIFRSANGADTYGQGELFVGSGVASYAGIFSVTPVGLAVGDFAVGTSTDATGNTSEFGLDQRVRNNPLPQPGTRLVEDPFDRTAIDSWGNADTGGKYQIHIPSGNPAFYDVAGSAGTMVLPPGATRFASLNSLSLMDVDAIARVRFDAMPAGGEQYAYILVRRAVDGSEYRMRLRLPVAGGLRLVTRKFVDGAEADVGTEVEVVALTPSAATPIWVRIHVSGADPTTLRMKAWNDGTAEPKVWAYTATDAELRLQEPGPVALRAHVEATTTLPSMTVSWQDFYVRAADPTDTLPGDFVPPTGSMLVNGGAASTSSPVVALRVRATDGQSGMDRIRISNSPAMAGALLATAFEGPYTTPVTWDLRTVAYGGSTTHGTRTVYVQWRDVAGNWSRVKSDSIVWN